MEYDDHGGGRGKAWHARWSDGPTIATMQRLGLAAAKQLGRRGLVDEVRFRREETARACVAALVQHAMDAQAQLAWVNWRWRGLAAETEFPDGVSAEAWRLADAALARPEVGDYSPAEDAIAYLSRVGLTGVQLDLWVTSGRQSDCQPFSPAEIPLMSAEVRGEVGAALARLRLELVGGATFQNDPRVQLLVAEAARRVVLDLVDEQQRVVAVDALVDGIGLSSLSTAIGLSSRALGMRWGGRVEVEAAPLLWLRDHAEEWARACRAAAAVLEEGQFRSPAARRELRVDLLVLEQADTLGGWRGLRGTPPAARRVLQAVSADSGTGQAEAVTRLVELLSAFDRAEPASRRERRSRRPPSA